MSSSILVSQLWDALGTDNGMEKVSGLTGNYLRDRIRETSVANRALPPKVVTENDVERNTDNDFPLMRIDIEPDSKAFAVGFRGKGHAQFFEGRKYEVYFTKLETEHFKKTREELTTMRYPVMDVVNNNFIYDMQEQVDGLFKSRLNVAAGLSGVVGSITATDIKGTFKDGIINAVKGVLGKRRRTAKLIMTEACWLNLAKLEPDKIGYDNVGRIAMNGVYAEKTFLGYEVITSINSATAGSVWSDSEIFVIPTADFLGSNFILGDVQQEFKREGNMLEWYSWSDQGIELGNVGGVGKVTIA